MGCQILGKEAFFPLTMYVNGTREKVWGHLTDEVKNLASILDLFVKN